jgi:hypothetical protein
MMNIRVTIEVPPKRHANWRKGHIWFSTSPPSPLCAGIRDDFTLHRGASGDLSFSIASGSELSHGTALFLLMLGWVKLSSSYRGCISMRSSANLVPQEFLLI